MELLIRLYQISAPSGKEQAMSAFIISHLTAMKLSHTTDKAGNIFVTKGDSDSYPCIVAHIDEVHAQRSKHYEVVLFRDELIFGYNTKKKCFEGIGADDKNGIWICLKTLEEFDTLKCAFFVGEETGCVGSRYADLSFFDDCSFVLQCDRRGNSDFINSICGNDLCSEAFINSIAPQDHGYRPTCGMITDVGTLKDRGLKVSCANISCGYYNPHCDNEYTNIGDLRKCHSFVRHILESCAERYPHYQPPRPKYYGGHFGMGFGEDVSVSFFGSQEYDDQYFSMYKKMEHKIQTYGDIGFERVMQVVYDKTMTQLTRIDYLTAYEEIIDFHAPLSHDIKPITTKQKRSWNKNKI